MANPYYVVINGTGGGKRIYANEEEVKYATKYAPEAKVIRFNTFEEANRYINPEPKKRAKRTSPKPTKPSSKPMGMNNKKEMREFIAQKNHADNGFALVEASLIRLGINHTSRVSVDIDGEQYQFDFAVFRKDLKIIGYIDLTLPLGNNNIPNPDKIDDIVRSFQDKLKAAYCREKGLDYFSIYYFDAINAETIILEHYKKTMRLSSIDQRIKNQ